MFKNLVKKIKGAAKKIAPYAGVIAGMFGAGPWTAAGIGALGGGLGGGGAKGAVLGGIGGFGAGTMWGGKAGYPGGNRLFGNPLNIFNPDKPFFNPDNQGIMNLLTGTRPVETGQQIKLLSKPELIHTGGGNMVYTKPKELATHMVTKPESGLARFKDALTMTNNPLTGKELDPKSMWRFLPAALGGTALAYGLGAFEEEPVPEEEIPTEYVYDAATDPLKNVNKRFRDYYQGITQVAPSSIYGYLQSIGALKEGGVPRGYSGGGSMAQKVDIPGQFLLNDPSKTPLSVLEAADGLNTSEEIIIEKFKNGEISAEQYYQMVDNMRNMERMISNDEKMKNILSPGIQGLESYVDTGEGEGIDKGLGAAKDVLQMGAQEAMKELGTTTGRSIGPAGASTVSDDGKRMLDLTDGQKEAVKAGADKVEMTDAQEKFYSSPSDEGKTFGNGEFYYDDPNLIRFIQRRADQNGTTYQEELMKFVDEVESFYRNKKNNMDQMSNGGVLKAADGTSTVDISDLDEDQLSIYNGLLDIGYEADEALQLIFDPGPQFLRRRRVLRGLASGGVASFNYGGQIMGPGTGREDVIPGKIVDKNTGQTSDMLVSNNEHIIPEYALYAMGGGDTKKGHDMMDALRKQTKPMAKKMGYDFKGAEDGSVMYG